jgi:hypothetical protein
METKKELYDVLHQATKIVGKKSDLGGYGVFASEDIQEGEVLEVAPFVVTGYRQPDLIHKEIRQICYTLPCRCKTCQNRGMNFILATGYIQLYNNSVKKSRSHIEFKYDAKSRTITVTAIKPIEKGEEILHYYGPGYGNMTTEEVK